MSIYKKIIVVLGPTASGKSELAVQLAQKFNGEIISADSRQVYSGLDIGTGKVLQDKSTMTNDDDNERETDYFYKGVRHHLIGIVSPKKVFTVAEYRKLARRAIHDILKRGKTPIICGGTGFYIDASLYNHPLPEVPPDLKLRKELDKESIETLFERLQKLDPGRTVGIDRKNKRRLIRALEIVIKSGRPVPPVSIRKSDFLILKIGIKNGPAELRRLIHDRLLKRIDEGMIEEVKKLHDGGLSWKRMEELGLEYRYVSRFLGGLITKKEMIEILEKEIWHYAKRQMTWFNKDRNIHWILEYEQAKNLTREFLKRKEN